jgi:hypothetical protein
MPSDAGPASIAVVQRSPVQLIVNQALLSFASCQYDRALELFRRAVAQIRQMEEKQQEQSMTSSRRRDGRFDDSVDTLLGTPSLSSLFSETCNNMALCAVYTCRLGEAIHLMESLVRQDPTRYLTDRVALNLWCVLWVGLTRASFVPLTLLCTPVRCLRTFLLCLCEARCTN